VELPEKQGLKHNVQQISFTYFLVAVELPEKQGLKLSNVSVPSIYTKVLQWNFQKNKD